MYRLFSLLFIILLGLAACTGVPSRPPPPTDALAEAARPLAERGDYVAAAQLYLSAAKTAPETHRTGLRLQAARLLAEGKQWVPLQHLLAGIAETGLPPQQDAEYRMLSAQLALSRHQPDRALNLLADIKSPESLEDRGRQYYRLRADAYAQSGNVLEAARQLIWLDGLLDDPAHRLENQYRIWEYLASLSDRTLQSLQDAAPRDALSGWMELVLLTRTYRGDHDRWAAELERWRNRYPRHAAEEALLPDLLYQVGKFVSSAKRIAVLLPLSGRAADSAAAIRDGILAAFYRSNSPRPEVRFYDTAANTQLAWSIYQQAIDAGADFVIGPLLKESIQSLSRAGQLPIPVLALNHSGEIAENHDLALYQFGLTPEDEARQVAERAIADGNQRLIALLPDNAWGERVYAAFIHRFTELGGEILAIERYDPRGSDFAKPIQRLLNLNDSQARHRALQRRLGEKLQFEPRRRQDAQAVFLLAFPSQARQIKPQLRFHHAGDLPVYATSHVYQAGADASVDRDLNGLLFCDMPWVLDRDGPWATLREQIERVWPNRGQQYQRLFALGFDAYQLVPWLGTLQLPGFAQIPGATGMLSVDTDKQLHRTLEWAQFKHGLPEIIRQPLTPSTEGQDGPENDR